MDSARLQKPADVPTRLWDAILAAGSQAPAESASLATLAKEVGYSGDVEALITQAFGSPTVARFQAVCQPAMPQPLSLQAPAVKPRGASSPSGHVNDVTVLSSARMYESAVSWLSRQIVESWSPDKSLDQVLGEVAQRSDNAYRAPHAPSLLITKDDHAAVRQRLTLVIANGDYNGDGTINAMPTDDLDLAGEADSLLSAYSTHGYTTKLARDLTASEIIDAAQALVKQAAAGDEVVLHYLGHGSAWGLVGTHPGAESVSPLPFEGVALNDDLQAVVNAARRKKVKIVLIADSCQSGFTTDLIRDFQLRGLERAVAEMRAKNPSPQAKRQLDEIAASRRAIDTLIAQMDDLYRQPLAIAGYPDLKVRLAEVGNLFEEDDLLLPARDDRATAADQTLAATDLAIRDAEGRLQTLAVERQRAGLAGESSAELDAEEAATRARLGTLEQEREPQADAAKALHAAFQDGVTKHYTIVKAMQVRHGELAALEGQVNARLVACYEQLTALGGGEAIAVDEPAKAWSLGVGALASLQQGFMAQATASATIAEPNRFTNAAATLSLAANADHVKLTEALRVDFAAAGKLGAEAGFSQSLDALGFRNWFHLAADYKLNRTLELFGGLELAPSLKTPGDGINAFVGLSFKAIK
jgi:hypothetical protein